MWLAGVLAIAAAYPPPSRAVYTDGGSILLFPHVESDQQWDTAIQIVNTSTSVVYADCHYVNINSGPGLSDFSIVLFGQQPTHWLASRGRAEFENDPLCSIQFPGGSTLQTRCDGAGFDPGAIPAIGSDFSGYLQCVQVDASGAPVSGNALAGTATLRRAGSADVAKYEALEILGFPANDADGLLCLGGDPGEGCPRGAEYQTCPEEWLFTLPAAGSGRGTIVPADEEAQPSLTIMPCAIDFASGLDRSIDLSLRAVNELEQVFTASARADGWLSSPLADLSNIFAEEILGTELFLLRVAPAHGDPPFDALVRVERSSSSATATGFLRGHPVGEIPTRVTFVTADGGPVSVLRGGR